MPSNVPFVISGLELSSHNSSETEQYVSHSAALWSYGRCVSPAFSSALREKETCPTAVSNSALNYKAIFYSPYSEGSWETCFKVDGFRLKIPRWRDWESQFVDLPAGNNSHPKHVKWLPEFCCHKKKQNIFTGPPGSKGVSLKSESCIKKITLWCVKQSSHHRPLQCSSSN